jgi:hypothetical protein
MKSNMQIADSTSALERAVASSSTCTWLHGVFLDPWKTTTSLMALAMNKTTNKLVHTEDFQEGQSESALRKHVYDFPSSTATELIGQSVCDRCSDDIEPAPMQANQHGAIPVDTLCFAKTDAAFAANAAVPVRGKGRKLCESFTANEWREQYQVLCIALFNHSRQSRADRDEDEGLRDAA